MSGFINILPISDEQIWEKAGLRYSLSASIMCATLPPFQSGNLTKVSGLLISEFKLRRLNISGDVKTIISTTSLSTSLLTIYTGNTYLRFYYNAVNELDGYAGGYYEYYIKDSEGNEYISEVFRFCGELETVIPGDFNNDFSNDFLT